MMRKWNNIYIFNDVAKRESLQDYYWPSNEGLYFNEDLIVNRKWHDGWFCQFTNKGLRLDIQSILTEEQYQYRLVHNLGIKPELCEFRHEFQMKMNDVAVAMEFESQYIEQVRKNIYLSKLFGENANQMWAAQFFENETGAKKAKMYLGFNREITAQDLKCISEIWKIFGETIKSA